MIDHASARLKFSELLLFIILLLIIKTELLWAGTKHNVSLLGCRAPTSQLGLDTVTPGNEVRVLGVIISSDLSLDQQVSKVCAASVYRPRPHRRIRK